MKAKQLRKARKLVKAATYAGVFGPDPDNIFYLMFTREIQTARAIVHRHGVWLISKERELYSQLVEIAAIMPPLFNRPDCNDEYWD